MNGHSSHRRYAGPRAVLSHTTAAWVWSLIETEPTRIHVTVPGRRRSLPNVRIHHSRNVDPVHSLGLPVTSVARALLDLAGVVTFRQLRRAVAEADYRGLLNADELAAVLGRGRRGSGALGRALAVHLPELAQTLSVLEEGWSATPGTRSPIARTRLPPISGGLLIQRVGANAGP